MPNLRCFYTTDIVGAELSGALKNVVAIACGMCIGCPNYKFPDKAAGAKLKQAQDAVKELDIPADKKAELLAMLEAAPLTSIDKLPASTPLLCRTAPASSRSVAHIPLA